MSSSPDASVSALASIAFCSTCPHACSHLWFPHARQTASVLTKCAAGKPDFVYIKRRWALQKANCANGYSQWQRSLLIKMAALQKLLLYGNAMCRRSLRALKSASSATALSQPVMASYLRCTAAPAASDFMALAYTNGFSPVASQTALIANRHGEWAKETRRQPREIIGNQSAVVTDLCASHQVQLKFAVMPCYVTNISLLWYATSNNKFGLESSCSPFDFGLCDLIRRCLSLFCRLHL